MILSYEAFTSLEVSTLPSWNFTPCRILNVYVRLSAETVHDSARSPTNFVPVLSVGSTRMSVLYCGPTGWSIPNVSSRCPSKLGGSAAPTKISSPPWRGFSWAEAGLAARSTAASAKQVRIPSDRLAHCPMATSGGVERCRVPYHTPGPARGVVLVQQRRQPMLSVAIAVAVGFSLVGFASVVGAQSPPPRFPDLRKEGMTDAQKR